MDTLSHLMKMAYPTKQRVYTLWKSIHIQGARHWRPISGSNVDLEVQVIKAWRDYK